MKRDLWLYLACYVFALIAIVAVIENWIPVLYVLAAATVVVATARRTSGDH